MNLLKSKWTLYIGLAVAAVFVGWYMWETSSRNKSRTSWMNWMRSQPATDPWKTQIQAKATSNGITFEEQLLADAYYLTPKNPFKPKL